MNRIPIQSHSPRHRRYRGMALLLVVAVIAVASVMGMAMLSMGALQTQATNTAYQLPALESLAESGINLGIYYLQNPWQSGTASNSYWHGQTGISLGASVPGTIDVTITSLGSSKYQVTSVGRLNNMSKTIVATMQVNLEFQIKAAGAFNGNVTFNSKSTVNGDVWSNGNVTENAGSTVNGKITAASGSTAPDTTIPTGEPNVVPPSSAVKSYFPFYTYNGTLCAADVIANTLSSAPTASASNPGGVFYCLGNLILSGNFAIPGTLIISNGRLSERAVNSITPKTGMPALVCDNEIEMNGNARSLTINGYAWVGQGVKGQSTTTTDVLTVNGALNFATGSFASSYSGYVNLTYDATRLKLPDFTTTTNQYPKNVKVLSWK